MPQCDFKPHKLRKHIPRDGPGSAPASHDLKAKVKTFPVPSSSPRAELEEKHIQKWSKEALPTGDGGRGQKAVKTTYGAFPSSLPTEQDILLCLLAAAACPAPGAALMQTHTCFPGVAVIVQRHMAGKALQPLSGISKFWKPTCKNVSLLKINFNK